MSAKVSLPLSRFSCSFLNSERRHFCERIQLLFRGGFSSGARNRKKADSKPATCCLWSDFPHGRRLDNHDRCSFGWRLDRCVDMVRCGVSWCMLCGVFFGLCCLFGVSSGLHLLWERSPAAISVSHDALILIATHILPDTDARPLYTKRQEGGDAKSKESVLEESDVESEAHVGEAFLAGWRAKQKTAGMRKKLGFQGEPSRTRCL